MKKVLLLGSYGRGNTGDDIFLVALVDILQDFEITINAADSSLLSEDVRKRVKIIPTNIMSNPLGIISTILASDYVIYGGGDLWVELYGDRFPRQSLYKMWLLNTLAKLTNKSIYYIGCGAGELEGYSKWLAKRSALLASRIIARDEKTIERLELKNAMTLPDIAINLFPTKSRRRTKNSKFTVGIAPMYHIPDAEVRFPQMLEELARTVRELSNDGDKIIIFPMLKSHELENDDAWVAKQLADMVPDCDVTIFNGSGPKTYIKAIGEIDMMVGVRLHANVIALLSNIPAIGIAYRPKVSNVFKTHNLSDYCLGLDELKAITPTVRKIQENYTAVKTRVKDETTRILARKIEYRTFIDANLR